MGVFFILLGIAVYLTALTFYAAASPFIAGAYALCVAAALTGSYAVALRGVLFLRTPRFQVLPPYRPEDEQQPAYRQYFFGPALRDLRQVIIIAQRRWPNQARDYGAWVTSTFFNNPRTSRLITVPIGLTLWAGLVVGCVLAALLLGALALLHAIVVLAAQAAARVAIGALQAIDTVILHTRGIRGMLCPWCYVRSAYPAYKCPRCDRRHSDVRPGRYGVARRRCACGNRMPTLLMLGSYRLPAMCTNDQVCGRQMSDETGRWAELVLPFFGGTSAGKTRLMASMIMGLDEPGTGRGTSIRLADSETRHSYDVLRDVLDIMGDTRGTQSQLPRAHSVRVTAGRTSRLVHIFDAAGERFADTDRTDELGYLRAARAFVFVLDPMSLSQFWNQLTTQEQRSLDRSRASTMDPRTVFDQSVQTMIQMGARVRRSRLAVAISKTDLIEHTESLRDRGDDSEWAEHWLAQSLGQGNLIRNMRNEFQEVKFFFTAAITVRHRHIHGSIPPLVSWCLQSERSRPGGGSRTGAHGRNAPRQRQSTTSGI